MGDYYMDIETNGIKKDNGEMDFDKSEIITISYQQIDCRSGVVKGDLNIMKAWESSEKGILQDFVDNIFRPFSDDRWGFIPIGFNWFCLHLVVGLFGWCYNSPKNSRGILWLRNRKRDLLKLGWVESSHSSIFSVLCLASHVQIDDGRCFRSFYLCFSFLLLVLLASSQSISWVFRGGL